MGQYTSWAVSWARKQHTRAVVVWEDVVELLEVCELVGFKELLELFVYELIAEPKAGNVPNRRRTVRSCIFDKA